MVGKKSGISLYDWCLENGSILIDEWDYSKNTDLDPRKVPPKSNKKAYWLCSKYKHSWDAPIFTRTKGVGCPYCANRKVLAGFNDLATVDQELASEWHPTQNDKESTEVTYGSSYEAMWICSKGHCWSATVNSRRKNGCPYCSNKKCKEGVNDLATTHPKLAEEWHPTQNDEKATAVTYGSSYTATWICDKGHCWSAVVYSRLVSGCPYCANKKLLKGYNDLQTKNSELCKEWNDNRNPEDFMEFSNEKVSWKCLHCGHEWSATIAHRSNGEGCPRCKRHHQKSVNEVAIAYYLDGLVEYEHGYRPDFLSGGELDIYIDSIRLGIEYDGRYFHEGRFEKDLMKDSVCKECGIEVIHIREKGLPQLKDSQTIQVDGEDYSSVDAAITQVLSIVFSKVGINPVIKVDVKRDGQAIRAKRFNDEVEGSFASKHPELLDEWAPSNKLKPQAVPEFANYNVDWICSKCNNTWSASPATRSKNSGCPFCSGRKVIPGVTDLATVKKDLAKEWHPTKNIITPKQVSVGSHEKVWWLGSCNHEWRAEIKSRALGGNKCPFCAGKEVLVGFNDLKSQKLELAKEWHPTQNMNLKPDMVTVSSGKKVWWMCEQKHEWKATIAARSKGEGCRLCYNLRRSRGSVDSLDR